MKIVRHDKELQIQVNSGIGYNVIFTAKYNIEADAEAWRVHVQNEEDRKEQARTEILHRYLTQIATLRNRVSALRGYITKLKRKHAVQATAQAIQ